MLQQSDYGVIIGYPVGFETFDYILSEVGHFSMLVCRLDRASPVSQAPDTRCARSTPDWKV